MNRVVLSLFLAAVLSSGPALAQGGFLGVNLEPAPQGATGARITSLVERSAASIMGLQAGDLVTAVDGVAVADPGALAQLIGSRLPGEVVELTIVRDGQTSQMLGVLARRPGAPRLGLTPLGGARLENPREWRVLPPGDFSLQLPDRPELTLDLKGLDMQMLEMMKQRETLLEEFQKRFQDMHRDFRSIEMPKWEHGLEFHADPGQIFLHPGQPLKADAQTTVRLRYPESTSAEDRERLQNEAIEKYGPEVQVEFSGQGTSVIIERRTSVGGASPGQPVPPAPPETTREF